MDEIQLYNIIYTKSATQDILEKADYIASELHENELALKWYHRFRQQLQKNLSSFPFMYPAYDREPWKTKGYRLLTTANDVVLYTVDENSATVYIHAVCTRGRDLSKHLNETQT